MLAEVTEAVSVIRAEADRDADEQREAAAQVLHDSRVRADHTLGSVSQALESVRGRLTGPGIGGQSVVVDSDETQLMPAASSEDTDASSTDA